MEKKPRHRLTNVDPEAKTATCAVCGPVEVRQQVSRWSQKGFVWQCREKRRQERREHQRTAPWIDRSLRAHLGPVCERCGFVPEDPCQLHIDHVIPRWKGGSNARENLQTLCANCHALKTKRDSAEWRKANPPPL